MSARLSTASLFAVAHWPAYGLRIGWLGLCIALLLSGCYARAAWAQPAPGVDPEKARELEILRSQINLLKATLEGQRKAEDATRDRLRQIDLGVAERAIALIELLARIQTAQAEFDALEAQRQSLDARLEGEREQLGKLLRSAYAVGQLAQLKLALSQERVGKIGRVLAYHSYLNRGRIEAISGLRQSLAELAEVRLKVQEKRSELETLAKQEDQRSQDLVRERSQRENFLAEVGADVEHGQQRLASLEVDRQRLQLLLNQIGDVLANLPSKINQTFANLRGSLPWPAKGKVSMAFGARDQEGRASTGISIQAEPGTAVRSVSYGRVAFADWLRGFGMLAIIDHGDGWMSLYGHCEALLKSEGEWVEAGDVIATIGASGGASEAGLHFEVRRKGLPIDPQRWLTRAP